MDTPAIIIPIGNTGSGKSTWVKKFTARNGRCLVVSRDSFRYMIGGGKYRFDLKLEPLVNKMYMKSLCAVLDSGKDVIVDETNVEAKLRQKYIQLAKRRGYIVVGIVFPKLTKQEAIDRRMSNPHDCPNRATWEMVWDKVNQRYDEPTSEEGFDFLDFLSKEEVGIYGYDSSSR